VVLKSSRARLETRLSILPPEQPFRLHSDLPPLSHHFLAWPPPPLRRLLRLSNSATGATPLSAPRDGKKRQTSTLKRSKRLPQTLSRRKRRNTCRRCTRIGQRRESTSSSLISVRFPRLPTFFSLPFAYLPLGSQPSSTLPLHVHCNQTGVAPEHEKLRLFIAFTPLTKRGNPVRLFLTSPHTILTALHTDALAIDLAEDPTTRSRYEAASLAAVADQRQSRSSLLEEAEASLAFAERYDAYVKAGGKPEEEGLVSAQTAVFAWTIVEKAMERLDEELYVLHFLADLRSAD
jgi:hypothetical protein